MIWLFSFWSTVQKERSREGTFLVFSIVVFFHFYAFFYLVDYNLFVYDESVQRRRDEKGKEERVQVQE